MLVIMKNTHDSEKDVIISVPYDVLDEETHEEMKSSYSFSHGCCHHKKNKYGECKDDDWKPTCEKLKLHDEHDFSICCYRTLEAVYEAYDNGVRVECKLWGTDIDVVVRPACEGILVDGENVRQIYLFNHEYL